METTKAAVEESSTSEEAIEADQVKDLDHTNTLAAFALHSQTESPKVRLSIVICIMQNQWFKLMHCFHSYTLWAFT